MALLFVLPYVACSAPAPTPAGDTRSDTGSPSPKKMIVGILDERKGWAPWDFRTSAGGAQNPLWLVSRTLTIVNDKGHVQPVLAAAVPSIERADWRIFPDGSMEQIWRIRPEAKWQDGRPVTADDFVFGWEVLANPNVPTQAPAARALVNSTTAVDPATLLVRFGSTTPMAGNALFDPHPRHILGDVYASGDLDRFINHEYWSTSYIGTGPYRLAKWELGSFMEFSAFADYVEGKPKIDTIVMKFMGDTNTLYSNILTGDVEVALPDGLSVEMAAELKRSWAAPGTGNQVILHPDGRFFRLEFQHKSEYAKPAAARDPRVRRAFYHTIDKEGVIEVELAGLGQPADSWITTDDPRRPQFKDAIPEWSYDLGLAQRVLAEAGWQRGPDGVLVHQPSGARMETEIRVTASQGHVKALSVMASGWRQAGAEVTETVMPQALLANREYWSTQPFAGLIGHTMDMQWEKTRYSCETAARSENRWTGNYYGYCNPGIEAVIDRLQTAVAESDRTGLQASVMRTILKEDYAVAPLYWQVTPIVFAKGISGLGELAPGPFGNTWSPWNAHLWDTR